MAALLHDIAKPQTKEVEDDRVRFLGHAQEGAEIVSRILSRLRFSSRETRQIELMVRHHLRPGQLGRDKAPSSRAIYRYFRDTGDAGIDIFFLNLADFLAARGPTLDIAEWRRHGQMMDYVLKQHFEQEETVLPPKLINGEDLIHRFGMKPGPRIGDILEAVREAQAAGEISTKEEAISYVRDHFLSTVA
jgi:poly(A) polymerase